MAKFIDILGAAKFVIVSILSSSAMMPCSEIKCTK